MSKIKLVSDVKINKPKPVYFRELTKQECENITGGAVVNATDLWGKFLVS